MLVTLLFKLLGAYLESLVESLFSQHELHGCCDWSPTPLHCPVRRLSPFPAFSSSPCLPGLMLDSDYIEFLVLQTYVLSTPLALAFFTALPMYLQM